MSYLIKIFVFFISFNIYAEIWHDGDQSPDIKNSDLYKIQKVFVDLAANLNPTVVNIFSTQTIRGTNALPQDLFGLFQQFYGRGLRPRMKPRKAVALGSGFIINEDGYILTNNHVIKNADEVKVKLYDEKEYKAKVLGFDPETDIALIKIDAHKKLKYAKLGKSSNVKAGEWVVAIGNPFGHHHTVTSGIVSAKGRVIPEVSVYNDFIQTDASINQGNSGGPLLDLSGNVIGINTAIDPRGQGSIGFAIPIDEAKKILPQLAKGESVMHESGWLGVGLEDLTPPIANYLGIKDDLNGVVVAQIEKNSPADKAGLKNYDVITKFNGKEIKNSGELSFLVKKTKPGTKCKINIIRSGKKKRLKLVLGSREPKSQTQKNGMLSSSLGMFLDNINESTIDKYKLDYLKPHEGILVTLVEDGSPASLAGIASEDVIVEVNKIRITSLDDYYKALKKSKKAEHLFRIKRLDRYFFTVVKNK